MKEDLKNYITSLETEIDLNKKALEKFKHRSEQQRSDDDSLKVENRIYKKVINDIKKIINDK